MDARRGRMSASIMWNCAFCRDKQKGETEADRALIASAIDACDRFNLRRSATCVWISANIDECVRALSYKHVHRTGESGI